MVNILTALQLFLNLFITAEPIFMNASALKDQWATKLNGYIDRFKATGEDMSDAELDEFRGFSAAAHAKLQGTTNS